MASLRYASYIEEEDWDVETLEVVNSHLAKYVKMLPEAHMMELSLAELQELAARQQAEMDSQHQALMAREARLQHLQQQEARHRQLAPENVRLRRMRERVEAQELKLSKLRALRGQVEHCQASNDTELEMVRSLFNEKEKELAMAVSRVDILMKQLHDLREVKAKGSVVNGNTTKGDPSVALTFELDRLRQELLHHNKLKEQQNSHLTTKQRLLQQRKDEASIMDSRIHELQQRLKKRRSQQPSSANTAAEQKSKVQSPGRKSAPNIAAVEPYIQHVPKAVVKDDLYSRTAFHKQDPKYQTLPPNTKFIHPGEDVTKSGNQSGNVEVNNNVNSGGDNSGVSSGNSGVSSGNSGVSSGNSGVSSGNSGVSSGNSGVTAGNSGVSGNVVGGRVKPVEFKIPSLISSHFNPHRGQAGTTTAINQTSSPDSSAPAPQSHTQDSTKPQPFVSSLPKGPRPFVNTFGKSGLPKWPPDPKKEEDTAPKPAGLQAPPHHPQITIFEEERQAGSGQSSPASSEGSGPLVKQGSGVFVHPLAASHTKPAASVNQARDTSQKEQKSFSGSSSLDSLDQETKHAPHTPHSTVSVNVISTSDQSIKTVTNSWTGDAEKADPPRDGNTGNATQGQATPTVQASSIDQTMSTLQGEEGKTGSTAQLNQRPAPTYRYASKNVIANTYMGRLGSSALERYQQLNKQLYKALDPQASDNQTSQPAPKKTLAGQLRVAFNSQDSSDTLGDAPPGMTQFGLVGSPNYPDIASDKGSFKQTNTPKQVRRRHSDSDNEDYGKAFHIGKKSLGGKSQSVDSNSNTNSSRDSAKLSEHRRKSESVDGVLTGASSANEKPSSKPSDKKTVTVVVKKKKTILKGPNRVKTNNRVRFDPLALLLDASLEGELDLVMQNAKLVTNVSMPNDEGITALHNAICAGHYDIVKFLIEFGADVNSPDSDGWTPLHCAASCNNVPMVRFLVEHGACIFATTISDNETAAEKCEEDEDGYDGCSDYLYSTQEKLGIANEGVVYGVFDFYASNKDEVTFRINNKMTVLRKGDEMEKEWWWARISPNKEGYIPRNLLGLFPRVLPSDYQPRDTSDC